MQPGQPRQIQVDTATLKAILKKDVEMVTRKKEAYRKQIDGLSLILTKDTDGSMLQDLLTSQGVVPYLIGLKEVAACELALMERQLLALNERLRRVESDIVVPGNMPGPLVS